MRRILDGGGAGGGVSTWLLAFEWGGGLGGTRGRIRVRWDLDTISRGFWSSNCSREEIWIHNGSVLIQAIHQLPTNCWGHFPLHLQEVCIQKKLQGSHFAWVILHPGQLEQENSIPSGSIKHQPPMQPKCMNVRAFNKYLHEIMCVSVFQYFCFINWVKESWSLFFIRTPMEPMTISFMFWTEVNRI